MSIDTIPTWSFILTCLAFVLFMQSTFLARVLVMARQYRPLWRWLFVAIPLVVSVMSFLVALNAMNTYTNSLQDFSFHISSSFAMLLKAQSLSALHDCFIQLAIGAPVFIMTLIAGRQFFPRVNRTPIWVLTRSRTFRSF